MTDNRTTELRGKLTEHGVKHEDSELTDFNDGTTTYYTEWGGNDDGDGANVYVEYVDGTVLRMFDATPEQAIAATLGDEPKSMRVFASMETALTIAEKEVEIENLKRENAELCDENAELAHRRAELEAAALVSERHAYEQRITGDGSDWGEIMRDAYDDLMASACEACTPEQMRQLTDYIRDEIGSERTCHAESDLSEWVCSRCQCWIPLGLTPENIKHASEWRYCPHCGARVKAVSDDER